LRRCLLPGSFSCFLISRCRSSDPLLVRSSSALAVFLAPGLAGPCLLQLFFTAFVQFVSLSASPNAAAWFSDFDSVRAWVSLPLLKGLYFSSGLLAPGPKFRCCFAIAEKNCYCSSICFGSKCELLQGEGGIILEVPDKKLEFF
jgi:hypothetical protein